MEMTSGDDPILVFASPFDEREAFEAKSRGYLSHVTVLLTDQRWYSVVFYDCARLEQDLDYEVSSGRMCVADVGMIVLPEITGTNMRMAVSRLAKEGYFAGLRSIQEQGGKGGAPNGD